MSSLFVLADAGFFQTFFTPDWPKAVAQSLTAAAIAALAARAWYRQRLTDKDLELKTAEDRYQGALRKKKAAEEELAQLKVKADALEANQPEAVLARFERETEAENYFRAKRELQEWFNTGRKPVATIAGELGEWYLSATDGEDGEAALPHAQRFIALAKLLEPENRRWDRTAEKLDVATVLDAIKAGRFDAADKGFDDSTLYDISGDPATARGLIEQCIARVTEEIEAGHYASAYLMARRAFRSADLASLRPDDPLSLIAAAQLASSLYHLGRYGEAEPLLRRTLAIRERVPGAEHPSTLASMADLATLCSSQARYDEAEPLYKCTLDVHERVLGAEHPVTLTSMNNLATLYDRQGRYGEAEPLHRRTLEISERILGVRHPHTLASMSNLALLYDKQGRCDEAEPLLKRALDVDERVLGAEHPGTLRTMNNLATVYDSQGRYGEAEPLYRRTLEVRERVLGAGHPDTLNSMNGLAGLYYSQGRYGEAEPLAERAVEGAERVIGPEHPDTQTYKDVLAGIRAALAEEKEDAGAS